MIYVTKRLKDNPLRYLLIARDLDRSHEFCTFDKVLANVTLETEFYIASSWKLPIYSKIVIKITLYILDHSDS